ncbi:dolichol kinase isoform X2 [Zootermopsis nevadensis]|uniref:dolichol kinase isoform X2 n=1 Tax=Zootermopsis nevadensis TaxID=136037 RepID=UPI000B8E9BAB|nr:dolichol kinase isoform X2 [Zootermopsis nevadensis]
MYKHTYMKNTSLRGKEMQVDFGLLRIILETDLGIYCRPKPGASVGIWMSFLLPAAIILSTYSCHNVTELYKTAATLSLGLLGTSVVFVTKPCNCKMYEYVLTIPPVFTYMLLYFYNGIGVWFSIAGGFASYSCSEAVILLLDVTPKCLTYGEASVLTQSLILFLFTTAINLVNTLHTVPMQCVDTATVILQVGLFGVLLICAAAYMFPNFRKPMPFYALTLAMVFGFVVPFLHILLQASPVLWILQLLVANMPRIWLVIYWVVCSGLAVLAVNVQIQGQQQASTVIRKYFHILAVAVFIPGLIRECCFLYLASGVVLALITALELLRVIRMPPLGEVLQAGFTVYADEKDAGTLALTPIYLLAGCSLPLWLYPSICLEEIYAGQHLLPLMSGLLTVGIGDTAASVFGTWIGKTKWEGTKKTKEGTFASIICQMILILMLVYLGHMPCSGVVLIRSLFAVTVTSVLEAKTDQVDNLALPLVMYMLLLPFPRTI